MATRVNADPSAPPPTKCDPTNPDFVAPCVLPHVFCFRITDIAPDKTDPTGGTFTFEFEILNWANAPAFGLVIALAQPDTSSVRFTAAGVDSNGRPVGPASMPPPGNLPSSFSNSWAVVTQTSTMIEWQAPGFGIPPGVPNRDLVGAANVNGGAAGTAAADALIPGFPGTTTIDAAGNVSPVEAIDNGDNVLDGFTFKVNNFNPLSIFQMNWFLEGAIPIGIALPDPLALVPLGTSLGGSNFGFGVIILGRLTSGGAGMGATVYNGNTGINQGQLNFFDSVFNVPDPALMAAEFGAGLTAAFVNPADNTFRAGINAVPRLRHVPIDIHPGSNPNSINPNSQGTIPVAILSTSTFDAPSTVDTSTLTFGRTGHELSLAFCGMGEDVNGDGLLDLVCHFTTQTAGFRPGDTVGILRGLLVNGTPIVGTDSVRTVPP